MTPVSDERLAEMIEAVWFEIDFIQRYGSENQEADLASLRDDLSVVLELQAFRADRARQMQEG